MDNVLLPSSFHVGRSTFKQDMSTTVGQVSEISWVLVGSHSSFHFEIFQLFSFWVRPHILKTDQVSQRLKLGTYESFEVNPQD
jgi:hypothetical protein